jgi:hypothetical protein
VVEAGRSPVVELLGAAHPMVRVTAAIAVVERQASAVGIVLVASVAATDGSVAIAVAASAAVVVVVLVAIVARLVDQRRRLAVDLIAEGREALPLRAVERERRRLIDLRARVRLARSYERVIEEALGGRRLAPGPPMVWPWVAAAVAAELGVVAELLRGARPGPRGVAFAERLLTDGGSPLYGQDVVALREELGRVRFQLCSEAGGNDASADDRVSSERFV